MKKILVCFLCALCLAGCGKRGKLDFPEGSSYPRRYPAAREMQVNPPFSATSPVVGEMGEKMAGEADDGFPEVIMEE